MFLEIFPILTNIVVAISAAITTIIAYKGINSWKEENKYKAKYELVKELFIVLGSFESYVNNIRDISIQINGEVKTYKKNDKYIICFNELHCCKNDLDRCRYLLENLLNEEFNFDDFDNLYDLYSRLHHAYFNYKGNLNFTKKDIDILCANYSEKDEFRNELIKSVNDIKSLMKTIL